MIRCMFCTQTVPFGRKKVLIQDLPQAQCFELYPSTKQIKLTISSTVAKALKTFMLHN